MKNMNRRGFLKSLAALSGTALLPMPLLAKDSIVTSVVTRPNGEKVDISSWKMSGAHWGAFRAKVEANRVVEILPFEFDQYPTDILDGTLGVIYSPSRVRYPMIRLDWYKNRHKSDTSQRGDNRFVRVGWDEALDLLYEELERVQRNHGPGRYIQQTSVGAQWATSTAAVTTCYVPLRCTVIALVRQGITLLVLVRLFCHIS